MRMTPYPACLATLLAVIVPVASAAPMVQVRDAPGGVYPSGSSGGFYLEGTAAITRVGVGGAAPRTEYAGTFDFEIDLLDGVGFVPFLSYCAQPDQGIAFGKHPHDLVGAAYEVRTLESAGGALASNADRLRLLWANAFEASKADALHASAFQLLIWEFAQDEVFDLHSGLFVLEENHAHTMAAAVIAETWMQAIENGTWTVREERLQLLHNDQSQNLLFIPAPAAFALLLGLFIGAPRRRR